MLGKWEWRKEGRKEGRRNDREEVLKRKGTEEVSQGQRNSQWGAGQESSGPSWLLSLLCPGSTLASASAHMDPEAAAQDPWSARKASSEHISFLLGAESPFRSWSGDIRDLAQKTH